MPEDNHRDQIKLAATPEYLEYHPAHATPCWVDLNLTAPTYVEEDNARTQVDLVAVIDRSGSMSGDKIDLVKETLQFVLTQLTAKDRLCLIIYDDEVESLFELTYVTEENRSFLESKINSITTRGSTNLCGGLLKGMRAVTSRTGIQAYVASVLLLTDGLANAGISSTEGILRAMRFCKKQRRRRKKKVKKRRKIIWSIYGTLLPKKQKKKRKKKKKKKENIVETVTPVFQGTVYTFGYGSDHNASMLKDISQAGNGVYFFIDTNEKIPESFADCLGGLLSTVGQNISLKIELSNGATISEFIAKKTPTYNANKSSAEVALGDLQSEEQRDVLMEIQLPICPDLGTDGGILNYASVTLSYFNVITAVMETVTADLPVSRTDTGKPKISNPLIDKQKNRILTMKALEEAKKKADEGKYEEGRQLLMECKNVISNSITRDELMVKGMLDDLDDMYDGMVDAVKYKKYGKSRAINALQAHTQQRSNFQAAPGKVMSYETKCKAHMKGKKK